MEYSCDSLQKYQNLSHKDLSEHIVEEFDHLLSTLDRAKRSVLTKSETVQRTYSLACVLWQSQEHSDLTSVLREDVFDKLVNWTLSPSLSPDHTHIKVAVDRVLCSMCSIKPDLFDRLLRRLNIIIENQGCENAYTFRHVIPDPEGESPIEFSAPVDLKLINLSENMFKSLSVISLSCMSMYKLIHSKFLSVLLDLVVDFIVRDKQLPPTAPPVQASAISTTSSVYPAFLTPSMTELMSSEPEVIPPNPTTYSTPYPPVYPVLDLSPLVNQSSYTVPPSVKHSTYLGPHYVEAVSTFAVPPSVNQLSDPISQVDDILPSSTTDPLPQSPAINIDMVTKILDFFADLSWQNIFRTWLSSDRNTVLWSRLLYYLCINVPKSQKGFKYALPSKPTSRTMQKLEETTLNFFSKCCCGHLKNQEKFAEVFCSIITSNEAVDGGDAPGISDFTRRILLELITTPGYVYVSIETGLPMGLNTIKTTEVSLLLPPPAFPTSKRHQLLYLNLDRTCMDILKKVTASRKTDTKIPEDGVQSNNNKEVCEMSWEDCRPSTSKQRMPVENPVPSPSKRFMDHDSIPTAKKLCTAQNDNPGHKLMFWAPSMNQYINVNQHWTIAEILQIFVPSGDELEVPVLTFLLSEQELLEDTDIYENNLTPPPALQKFVASDGFQLIAANIEKKFSPLLKRPTIGPRSVKRGRICALNQISIHTLLAFGQFLRLPDYRNNKDTRNVVQAIMGSGKESTNFNSEKYSNFFSEDVSKMCNPLMVLPFELLRMTFFRSYNSSPNDPELDVKYAAAIDFVLLYLSVYTHQPENKDLNVIQENKIYMKAIRQCHTNKKVHKSKKASHSKSYWPKGTGYSNDLQVDVPTDISRVEEEEELVSSLLMVLGNYICPHPNLQSDSFVSYKEDICNMLYMRHLPPSIVTTIEKSCLLSVIMSYLKNDSVFDMVKHVPLYKSIMFVIRTIISNVQLASLILNDPNSKSQSPGISCSKPESIVTLMAKLKTQINTYLHRTKRSAGNISSSSVLPDDSDIQEQILFVDICNTADIIEAIKRNCMAMHAFDRSSLVPQADSDIEMVDLTTDPEVQKDYVKIMKTLQFDQYEIMVEDESGVTRFNIPYHFQSLALQAMVTIPTRMKRLAMEMTSLASSLPISNESAIFVRHDESRIDILKALITGPAGTPYMNGCFEFDIFCPSDYPNKPVMVNFQTTGRGAVRFNPNLYNSGKVCLSLLGTWHGETWNPKTSSILQVLVSIQAMILISEPYFNEPGWEANRGTKSGTSASKAYNDDIILKTIRYAMINQIASPTPCFKKIIHTHFWLKKDEIKAQVTEWLSQSKEKTRQNLQAEAAQLFNDLDKLTLPD